MIEVDISKKKKIIAASVDVLLRGLGNFGHDPSSGKFDVD